MSFDFFIALDGNGLNGFEGFGGVARLKGHPEAGTFGIDVKYFDGFAGGHATQLNPSGTVGFLGNLSQTLLFYDPRTLKELRRFSTLRFCAPDTFYSSQTHVVWLDDETFVTVLGPGFYRFNLNDLEHPELLGAHGVTLPHALKRSPSGRYLFYGAMDHDTHGYANQAGVFDLQTGTARVVKLPATAWHLGVHPTKDVFYAPTQRCAPHAAGQPLARAAAPRPPAPQHPREAARPCPHRPRLAPRHREQRGPWRPGRPRRQPARPRPPAP